MKKAEEAGCTVLGGWPMLVEQAREQFRLFTGQKLPGSFFSVGKRIHKAYHNKAEENSAETDASRSINQNFFRFIKVVGASDYSFFILLSKGEQGDLSCPFTLPGQTHFFLNFFVLNYFFGHSIFLDYNPVFFKID